MKKVLVGLVLILWVLAGVQLWNLYGVRDQGKIVEAFHSSDFMNKKSVVEGSGRLNTTYLSLSGRKTMVQDIANILGIHENYTLTETYEDGQAKTVLHVKAKQAETTIQIITNEQKHDANVIDAKQYLLTDITLYDLDSALGYKEILDKIYEDYRIDTEVSLNLIGTHPGQMTLNERNTMADRLLEQIEGKVVSEHRDEELFTIYAYTKLIKDYDMRSGEPVNVNIAFNYDESQNVTNVYLSTPIIREDY